MKLLIDLQAAQAGNGQRGIGRYAMGLTEALLRQAAGHEVWIALNDAFPETIESLRAAFDTLLPQRRIVVWKAPTPAAGNDPANGWRRAAGEVLRESFFASIDPDVAFVPSLFEGLFDDAVTSVGVIADGSRTAVTIHDLIPLIEPDRYLSDPAVEAAYQRKITSIRRAGLWLAVSDWSRREAIERLDLPPGKAFVVPNAADSRFRQVTLTRSETETTLGRFGLTRPFLMYTGGGDPRKNIEGLLGAYARLPGAIRASHQLAIVCATDSESVAAIRRCAQRAGLAQDELVLTGFVSDADLVALYNLCRAFCFPSLLEGFGLPALEAMQCGAPTIGAGVAGIPEVIGRADALFDPRDEEELAAKLEQVLTDRVYRQGLIEHGLERARSYSWQESASRAWASFERHQKEMATPSRHAPLTTVTRRPRLAYISPLPPERTGIAEYSAELLPELSRYYDIDVIVSRLPVADPWVSANCPAYDAGWFDENAHLYDRILYHFGNSVFHRHMFDLFGRHPGVVVLHDFYLSGIIAHMDIHEGREGFWPQSLYRSHGYPAIQELDSGQDNADVVWKYPANLAVLQNALGVIVHNEYCRTLGAHHYGRAFVARWEVIPQLRRASYDSTREAARRALGFAEHDFVVCSFGVMGPIKLNDRLLRAWLASDCARAAGHHLVFVGEDAGGQYAEQIRRMIGEAASASGVRITGFTTAEEYRQYLSAADVAVQLRTLSRGETSRAVLDCMAHGLPIVTNAHGALAELPGDCAVMLPEEFIDAHLISAIDSLRADAALRAQLGVKARAYLREHHSPRLAAERYRAAIDGFTLSGREAVKARAVAALTGLESTQSGKPEWLTAARALYRNIPWANPQRQLLVDVSELVRKDVGTGIQRMVRSILRELIRTPPANYRIEPVWATEESRGYRYARAFTERFLGCTRHALRDAPLDHRPGDLFLGLDLQPHVVPRQAESYAEMRRNGVEICFIVYDLLPLVMPRHFAPGAAEIHGRWLSTVATFADRLICVSRAVADEVIQWLDASQKPRGRALQIGWVHLGADFDPAPREQVPSRPYAVPASFAAAPSFLMVGTIEPRKCHAQALDAFEKLWARGVDVGLVIVGRQGWMVEKLIARIRTHRERDRRLIWLEHVSDDDLEALYASCSCLLAASEGEGFGLPLIEAGRHGLPILARDIPVFREVAGPHARYFHAASADDLAGAVEAWLASFAAGTHEKSDRLPWLAWAESAERLKSLLLGNGWYADWPPAMSRSPRPERNEAERPAESEFAGSMIPSERS